MSDSVSSMHDPPEDPIPELAGPTANVKSQKARGIMYLMQLAADLQLHTPGTSPIYKVDKPINFHPGDYWRRTIARPCPVRPRHGFVDSRPVTTWDEVEAIRRETYAADPDGELLFMEMIDADVNAIIHPGGFVLGPGTDGATSGRRAVNLPVGHDYIIEQRHTYGLNPDDAAYLELVQAGSGVVPHLVQVRAGPVIGGQADYVPEPITVNDVVEIDGSEDLLEWETRAQNLAGTGTVVYHPGGSLASHFGVHCALNGVPYLTTYRPDVGDALEGTGEPPAWDAEVAERLARMITAYDLHLPNEPGKRWMKPAAIRAMATLHALGSLMRCDHDHALKLTAWSLANLPRVLAGLVLGEVRHMSHATRQRSYTDGIMTLLPDGMRTSVQQTDRDIIYDHARHLTLPQARDGLFVSAYIFDQLDWHSGYGGEAWEKIARYSLRFVDAVIGLVNNRNPESLHQALSHFNVVINLAHNNGWWFNKILDKEHADAVARMPALGLVSGDVYNLLTDDLHLPDEAPTIQLDDTLPTRTRNEVSEAIDNADGTEDEDEDGGPPQHDIKSIGAANDMLKNTFGVNHLTSIARSYAPDPYLEPEDTTWVGVINFRLVTPVGWNFKVQPKKMVGSKQYLGSIPFTAGHITTQNAASAKAWATLLRLSSIHGSFHADSAAQYGRFQLGVAHYSNGMPLAVIRLSVPPFVAGPDAHPIDDTVLLNARRAAIHLPPVHPHAPQGSALATIRDEIVLRLPWRRLFTIPVTNVLSNYLGQPIPHMLMPGSTTNGAALKALAHSKIDW